MLFFRSFSNSRWTLSEFSELPALDPADAPALRDYRLLLGGLALLLSRCSEPVAQRHFCATLQAYRALKRQMKAGSMIRLPSQLLSDLSHEIAQFADAATRQAALRCLNRSARTAAAAHAAR